MKAVKERLHSQGVQQQVEDNEQIGTASPHRSKEHGRVSRSDQESQSRHEEAY